MPALVFAGVLRALLLSYSPYAYWGSDSNSYFSFTELLLTKGRFSLYDKRRYVYLLAMLPVSLLPGAMLRWLALLQHAAGLLTLVPLAYCVRKSLTHWRWLVVPVTMLYAGLPMILWYEHELLAETLLFSAVIWSCAGWMAWVSEAAPERKRRLWWCFFAAFAVVSLTKPSAVFFWPGLLCALLLVRAWRSLRWVEAGALAALALLTRTIGQESQGAWLLYTSAFPLTCLETPLHADYKEEIRDLVGFAQQRISGFKADEDRDWKYFLKNPGGHPERPLWAALSGNDALKTRIYKDLAVESIKAHPLSFLDISFQRIMSSANPDDFKAERFGTTYYPERFEHLYERYREESPWRLRRLFGLSGKEPLPTFAEFRQRLVPDPAAPAARWLGAYADGFDRLVRLEYDASHDRLHPGHTDHLLPLGWWMLGGAAISLGPRYARRLGVWAVIIGGYLVGVFLVGGANPRFFGAAWGVLVILLAVPLDAAAVLALGFAHRGFSSSSATPSGRRTSSSSSR